MINDKPKLPLKIKGALMWAALTRNPAYRLELFVMTNVAIWAYHMPGFNLERCIFTCGLAELATFARLPLEYGQYPWAVLLFATLAIWIKGVYRRSLVCRQFAFTLASFWYIMLTFSFFNANIYTAGDGVYLSFALTSLFLVWRLGRIMR